MNTHFDFIPETSAHLLDKLDHGHGKVVIDKSSTCAVIAALIANNSLQQRYLTHVIIVPDTQEAVKLKGYFGFFCPGLATEVLTPPTKPMPDSFLSRSEWAARQSFFSRLTANIPNTLFVLTAEAVCTHGLSPAFQKMTRTTLQPGDLLDERYLEYLSEVGYQASPFVEMPGDYSVKGGIVDLFAVGTDYPVRIERAGNEILSLRTIDVQTQRTIGTCQTYPILPLWPFRYCAATRSRAVETLRQHLKQTQSKKVDPEILSHLRQMSVGERFAELFDYKDLLVEGPSSFEAFIPQNALLWIYRPGRCQEVLKKTHGEERDNNIISALFPASQSVKFSELKTSAPIVSVRDPFHADEENFHPQVIIRCREFQPPKDVPSWVADQKKRGWTVMLTDDPVRKSLGTLLEREGWDLREATGSLEEFARNHSDTSKSLPFSRQALPQPLAWEGLKAKLLPVTERRKRDYKRKQKDYSWLKKEFSINSITQLSVRDYVVHTLHGIGQYMGLVHLEFEGVAQEFLEIKYQKEDKLYVPAYNMQLVYRYADSSARIPLDKLGGTGWQRQKTKTQEALREVAHELLQLYAERRATVRVPIEYETGDMETFEEKFPYQETADQINTIIDIKEDLGRSYPMDRLICGDVGFGKTEIAMRVAFAFVHKGYQVVFLAPTTVLTLQHFKTLKARFEGWPVRIECLNRLTPRKKSIKVLQELKDGSVDIVVGTHRLLSDDVGFGNLGLLIIDEEHRFGVRHKEKIKKTRSRTDCLAMSATPIPRSLNMSLTGIRDLSMITTPPQNRRAVYTTVMKFSWQLACRAIEKELSRGGQIYFLHNRVQSIHVVKEELTKRLPHVRAKVAHGQMPESQLERVMLDFFEKKIDLLLTTTIVESGMDVSAANTMIVDDAHKYGLSQLYQLRGRIGRAEQQAYCYLMYPPRTKLTDTAEERLRVIVDNTELGSGLKIAQHDLEIRGAGELLGESQSGHIRSLGAEMYYDLLESAIEELRTGETDQRSNPELNVPIASLIPSQYIPDMRIRLSIYKVVSMITDENERAQVEADLGDQFGQPPPEVLNLLDMALVKACCQRLGVNHLRSGSKNLYLSIDSESKIEARDAIELVQANQKYRIVPDGRLSIQITEISWKAIHGELVKLEALLT